MSVKILLTGATGFTGGFVCEELLKRGIQFDCLVRYSSNTETLKNLVIELVEGDLNDIESLRRTFSGYQTLINVASLGLGTGPSIVRACQESGIKRAVFVSTTAIFTKLNAQSKVVRQAAEDAIRQSDLNYTILRPTMVYGTPGDRNMIRLLRFIQRFPIIPIFGSGQSLQQPVHVEDVAWAIGEVLDKEITFRRDYNISGGQVLSYNEVIQLASQSLGKSINTIHLPVNLSLSLIKLANSIGIKTPVTTEQILRLNEDKVFDHNPAKIDFNYSPRSFVEGIAQEVALMSAVEVS
ncbi:SDR family oxidoreductase [Oscillatoria sp. HE19RPO]|uniref:SDR family oxidoreductase n=1 Tax=Oscillatoria sp. HE19RPO TaxID=2954806 RepID=UPI0020C27FDB|nr:NAD(P)H-binding protein [Oscillatoria sp. HE19RPO]